MSRLLRNGLLALGLTAFLVPAGADAQLREIVSKNVSASSSGTLLEIVFADDGALAVQFDDGDVYVGSDLVGYYEPGDELDRAWRTVLGQAMALENGALAEMLDDWEVPADVAEHAELSDVAEEIDEALEAALRVAQSDVDVDDATVSVSIGDETAMVRLLLRSLDRLGALEDAFSELDDFALYIDEDVVVSADESVEETIVVIEGTLRIEGEVEGDVVVVGGELDLRDGSVVRGEVRIADTRVVRNQGESVEGGIVDLLEDERDTEQRIREQLRDEIRAEIRSDLRNEIRNVTRFRDDGDGFSIMSPLRPVIRGVGGVMEKLIIVFILGLVGAGFLAFAGENMDTIAETARKSPGRSAMVGFAGSFLLIPVWLLGAVALCVSIIGIPVAVAWLPLFPMAAALAALLGYIAVAQNAGEWLADSSWPWTGWIRKSNPIITLVGGLLGLTFAFIVGHVVSIAPFLDIFSGLLFFIGGLLTFFAIMIGFGAVLLTRGGRRREYYGPMDAEAAWEAAMNVDVDDVDAAASADPGDDA